MSTPILTKTLVAALTTALLMTACEEKKDDPPAGQDVRAPVTGPFLGISEVHRAEQNLREQGQLPNKTVASILNQGGILERKLGSPYFMVGQIFGSYFAEEGFSETCLHISRDEIADVGNPIVAMFSVDTRNCPSWGEDALAFRFYQTLSCSDTDLSAYAGSKAMSNTDAIYNFCPGDQTIQYSSQRQSHLYVAGDPLPHRIISAVDMQSDGTPCVYEVQGEEVIRNSNCNSYTTYYAYSADNSAYMGYVASFQSEEVRAEINSKYYRSGDVYLNFNGNAWEGIVDYGQNAEGVAGIAVEVISSDTSLPASKRYLHGSHFPIKTEDEKNPPNGLDASFPEIELH